MGKDLLLIAGLCWVALLLAMLGTFLRRYRFLKVPGIVIQVFAFLTYLLGLAGTVALFYSAYDRDGWMAIMALIGVFTAVPLGVCSVFLFKAVRGNRSAHAHAAPPSKGV